MAADAGRMFRFYLLRSAIADVDPLLVTAIESGAMQGWVAQQRKLIGRPGVEAAIDLAKGKRYPPRSTFRIYIATKANLGEPQIQAMQT